MPHFSIFTQSIHKVTLNKVGNWISVASGWSLDRIEQHFILNVVLYNPITGSSNIDLPGKLKVTKSLLSVQIEDDECFR